MGVQVGSGELENGGRLFRGRWQPCVLGVAVAAGRSQEFVVREVDEGGRSGYGAYPGYTHASSNASGRVTSR